MEWLTWKAVIVEESWEKAGNDNECQNMMSSDRQCNDWEWQGMTRNGYKSWGEPGKGEEWSCMMGKGREEDKHWEDLGEGRAYQGCQRKRCNIRQWWLMIENSGERQEMGTKVEEIWEIIYPNLTNSFQHIYPELTSGICFVAGDKWGISFIWAITDPVFFNIWSFWSSLTLHSGNKFVMLAT